MASVLGNHSHLMAKEKSRSLFVGWLLNVPANRLVYLRDGSVKTILRAATLR